MNAKRIDGTRIRRLLLISSYFAALVFLTAFNVQSIKFLSQAKQDFESRNVMLEAENRKVSELNRLENKHKQLELEFAMLEKGLSSTYLKGCESLEQFIPVDEDQLIACKIIDFPSSLKRLQNLSNLSSRLRDCYVFHVPQNGEHRLSIEAATSTVTDAVQGKKPDKATSTESIALENGKKYALAFVPYEETVVVSLTDSPDILIDFPIEGAPRKDAIEVSRLHTCVTCPNQLGPDNRTGEKGRALPLATKIFTPDGVPFDFKSKALIVRATIESEGPLVSLPDDIYVVRKLLDDFAAGIETKFQLGANGWYEFPKN